MPEQSLEELIHELQELDAEIQMKWGELTTIEHPF